MDLVIQENVTELPVKKKRGRKPKPKDENEQKIKPAPKKRGRKPKGGKLIDKSNQSVESNNYIQENVILHLKCNSSDISQHLENDIFKIESFEDKNNLNYQEIKVDVQNEENIINNVNFKTNIDDNEKIEEYSDIDNKDITKKIKELQKQLFFNECSDKKSACFWCTYDFDNQSIHIPKYKLNESYHVYGCFCSPECAVSHLMNESIDVSQKYERFHLLNYIYGTIFDYSQDIKPAPNPYFTLDKYYGNLTISEYRHLLKNNRFLLVVEKPLTRILPEIYEETDVQFSITNNYSQQTTFQIKKNNTEVLKKKSIF